MNEMTKDTSVQVIGGIVAPQEIFLSSKKAIASKADIKGMKSRAAGDGGTFLSRMGASVVMIAGGEIFDSLQRGVIDAAEIGTPGNDYTLATYEVIKYLYLSPVRQPSEWVAVIVGKKWWATMPDGLKLMITEMVKASAANYLNKIKVYDSITKAQKEYRDNWSRI